MIPVLYKNSSALGDVNFPNKWDTVGLGLLTDCISCTVTESTDGQFEAMIVYPVNGRLYDQLQNGAIVGCDSNASQRLQPFIVYRRELNSDATVSIYAHHVSYALNNAVFPTTASVTMSLLCFNGVREGMLSTAVIGRGDQIDDVYGAWFTYTIDGTVEFAQPINIDTPMTVRAIIQLIIDETGCEVEYDRFNVIFHERRGSDNGVTVRYGGNLTSAQQEYDTSSAYSGVVPYWINSSDESVFPLGINQFLVEEPLGSGEVFPGQYKRRLIPLDMSDLFDTQPTTAQLTAAAQDYLEQNTPWSPFNSLTINFVPYEQDPEQATAAAAVQNAQLYDTVRVIVPPMDTDVTVRVIKTVYNVLLDRYDSLEVGQPQVTLSDVYGGASASKGSTSAAGGVADSLKVVSVTVVSSLSIAANSYQSGSKALSAQTGWTPLGVVSFNFTGSSWPSLSRMELNQSSINYGIRNLYSGTITVTLVAKVLYVRTSL